MEWACGAARLDDKIRVLSKVCNIDQIFDLALL
jgi:hypothetical protein